MAQLAPGNWRGLNKSRLAYTWAKRRRRLPGERRLPMYGDILARRTKSDLQTAVKRLSQALRETNEWRRLRTK